MATTKEIQRALMKAGFGVGKAGADGILGPNTLKAIKAFQRSKGLKDDGIVGRETSRALFGEALHEYPQWMLEANRYMGLHEVRDAKKLDKALDLDASEIPWCGAFAALIIRTTLPDATIPDNPLWARNWAKFGVQDAPVTGQPHYGAIAVFTRNTGGHVGFVVGHDKTHVFVLGGNQSNAVTVTKVAKSQLIAYRYPEGLLPIGSPLPFTKFDGAVFNNEA